MHLDQPSKLDHSIPEPTGYRKLVETGMAAAAASATLVIAVLIPECKTSGPKGIDIRVLNLSDNLADWWQESFLIEGGVTKHHALELLNEANTTCLSQDILSFKPHPREDYSTPIGRSHALSGGGIFVVGREGIDFYKSKYGNFKIRLDCKDAPQDYDLNTEGLEFNWRTIQGGLAVAPYYILKDKAQSFFDAEHKEFQAFLHTLNVSTDLQACFNTKPETLNDWHLGNCCTNGPTQQARDWITSVDLKSGFKYDVVLTLIRNEYNTDFSAAIKIQSNSDFFVGLGYCPPLHEPFAATKLLEQKLINPEEEFPVGKVAVYPNERLYIY